MNDKDRQLIRQFYQSIPTQAEKDAFTAVIEGSRSQKLAYTAALLGKSDLMTPELIEAILGVSVLTKQDRIVIFSGWFRNLILSWLGF